MDKLNFLNKELGLNYNSLSEINWNLICEYHKLSENFICEFKDKLDWNNISIYQKLSEEFICEFKDKLDWNCISVYQKLSENFIREFKDKLDWYNISVYQKLSENFIREFQNDVYWVYVSKYQKLSEEFIREFKNKVEWRCISKYQKLSSEFINEFILIIYSDNWLYKSTEFKKKQIIDCGLYECHDDYFIAYKAIRYNRYSHYNFHYQYLPNEIYESHCDCTFDDASFGLSVWTYEGAKLYNNKGLIVKVKVRYEDVGILLYDNKIRCSKIEVLD